MLGCVAMDIITQAADDHVDHASSVNLGAWAQISNETQVGSGTADLATVPRRSSYGGFCGCLCPSRKSRNSKVMVESDKITSVVPASNSSEDSRKDEDTRHDKAAGPQPTGRSITPEKASTQECENWSGSGEGRTRPTTSSDSCDCPVPDPRLGGYDPGPVWGPNRDESPQLGPQSLAKQGMHTLVLDLDETLVHSSFRCRPCVDITLHVPIEDEFHGVFVKKRPGLDLFLTEVGKLFEVIIFTASLPVYANALVDLLDPDNIICWRLFRSSCTRTRKNGGGYIKDLSKLGRDLRHTIIIDNSPVCSVLQPFNALPIRTWRDDPTDIELYDLIPILTVLARIKDITVVLRRNVWSDP